MAFRDVLHLNIFLSLELCEEILQSRREVFLCDLHRKALNDDDASTYFVSKNVAVEPGDSNAATAGKPHRKSWQCWWRKVHTQLCVCHDLVVSPGNKHMIEIKIK